MGQFHTLEAFKLTKDVKQDMEDMEKVIANAYTERKAIAESVCPDYLKELEVEYAQKLNALLKEVKDIFEVKDFETVASSIGSKVLYTYSNKERELIITYNSALKDLLDVIGDIKYPNNYSKKEMYGNKQKHISIDKVRTYLFHIKHCVERHLNNQITGVDKPFKVLEQ